MATRFGGVTTTLFLLSLMVFFGLSVKTMLKREGDKITMGMKFYIGEEGIVRPKADLLKFYFSIEDPEYNNDDNPYVKFKLHKYTNLDNNDLSKPVLPKF